MTEKITNYKKKKVKDYLEPHKKYLIDFHSGLGDCLMWMPAFEKLREEFPDVAFDLYVTSGQEKIFPSSSYPDLEDSEYDKVFSLNFPMSEGSDMTKVEKCCKDELGIEPPKKDVIELPNYESPIVALHFQGTALPNQVNCPEETAYKIWQEVKSAGKIPLEVHFKHIWHNPANKRYPFVDNTVREYEANLKNLIGLLQHCFCFIGVASGPFVTALSVMPDRTFFLEKNHKLSCYTKEKLPKMEVDNFEEDKIKSWLNKLNSHS